MGNRASGTGAPLQQVVKRAEDRIGSVTIQGRYHRLPKCLDDDYEIQWDVLGSGLNGNVVLATSKHGVPGRFAVKEYKLHGVDAETRKELENEVEIFLSLDHPHVARLYDVYESKDKIRIVMECCDGGEMLARVQERKVFTERDAKEATWQMLLAVNYIHSEGIAHRDLKLENFLFEKKGSDHLKLIDFGFGKIWDKSNPAHMHAAKGTLRYVAPEVLDKNYTSQCDLWSLGVTVFILLFGYMPFSGSSDQQLLRRVREGKYSMNAKPGYPVSDSARDFVKQLLVLRPSDRLTAPQALRHPWIAARSAVQVSTLLDYGVRDAMCAFASASSFQRACMQLSAWSLPCDERAKVRGAFLELDTRHKGVIQLRDLQRVLEEKFQMPERDAKMIIDAFWAMDADKDGEVHYSDFLAAMMFSARLAPKDETIEDAFRRFDIGGKGIIDKAALRQVLGDHALADEAFDEVHPCNAEEITVKELVRFVREGKAADRGSSAHGENARRACLDDAPTTKLEHAPGCLPFRRRGGKRSHGGA